MSQAQKNPAPPALVKLGEIQPEVLQAITGMRERVQDLTNELGRMELRKLKIVHEVNRLENSTQGMLRSEAEQVGIPEGVPWQLTPEGHIMVVPEVSAALSGEAPSGD